MLVIRLTRVGKKNSPAYRVVVADKRKAVKRKFIEIIGHYNPTRTPKELVIDKEKALSWIKQGAQPSDTVNNLMCDLEILPKKQKIKKVYAREQKKKEASKEKSGTENKPVEEKADEKVAVETENEVSKDAADTESGESVEAESGESETENVDSTVE